MNLFGRIGLGSEVADAIKVKALRDGGLLGLLQLLSFLLSPEFDVTKTIEFVVNPVKVIGREIVQKERIAGMSENVRDDTTYTQVQ